MDKQLSKTESKLKHLESRLNLSDTGLMALMSILGTDPYEWYKTINDEQALATFNRNLSQAIQKFNSEREKLNQSLSQLSNEDHALKED